MTTQIRVEQISFAAGRVPPKKSGKGLPAGAYYLLREISFEVFRGDRIATVGASGAGKTSLLRLLNRLNESIQGAIYFEKQDIQTIPVLQLRQQIMLVPQEPKLLGMNVREALQYPLKLREVPKREVEQRIGEWKDRLRIPGEWFDRNELQLSVGERQWVAIARALICQPPVLMLDEPTSALDVGRSDLLIDVLTQASHNGQTILLATHQLELAQQFCQRVLHLQRGLLNLNESSDRVDWQNLREAIAQIEAAAAAEWD